MSKEKIDTNPEKRLKKIIDIAIEIQNSRKRKKMKKLAHEIEILANTKLIKGINKSMEELEKGCGKFITVENKTFPCYEKCLCSECQGKLEAYKKAKQEEREKILKEFEKFWKQFEKDYDVDGRKIKFELLDSDLEFLKTKTKEIIKKNE